MEIGSELLTFMVIGAIAVLWMLQRFGGDIPQMIDYFKYTRAGKGALSLVRSLRYG